MTDKQPEQQPDPKPRLIPVCKTCGSKEVRSDAYTAWCVETQSWEIITVFDNTDCENCGGECWIKYINEEDYDDKLVKQTEH